MFKNLKTNQDGGVFKLENYNIEEQESSIYSNILAKKGGIFFLNSVMSIKLEGSQFEGI